MKKVLCVLAGVLLVTAASAQVNPIYVYASLDPVPTPPITTVPSIGLPVGDCSQGDVTITLWAETNYLDTWNGFGLSLVDGQGQAMACLTGGIINPDDGGFPVGVNRWHPDSDLDFGGDGVVKGVAVTERGIGGNFDAYQAYVEPTSRITYLGSVVCGLDCCPGDVYAMVNDAKINQSGVPSGESVPVYFGIDTVPVNGRETGAMSANPLFSCVPEPASLVLIALAGLVIRRR